MARSARRRDRVLLVSMPLGALERPSLALGLLQAHCRRLEVDCETRYLGIPFAERIGVGEYHWLNSDVPYTAFAGDWLFAEALYGPQPELDAGYVDEVLRATWRLDDGQIARLWRLRARGRAVPRALPDDDRLARVHLRRFHFDVPAEPRVARSRRAREGEVAGDHDRLRRRELGRGDGRGPASAVPVRRPRVLRRGRPVLSRGARGAAARARSRRGPGRHLARSAARRREDAGRLDRGSRLRCRSPTSTRSSTSSGRARSSVRSPRSCSSRRPAGAGGVSARIARSAV